MKKVDGRLRWKISSEIGGVIYKWAADELVNVPWRKKWATYSYEVVSIILFQNYFSYM